MEQIGQKVSIDEKYTQLQAAKYPILQKKRKKRGKKSVAFIVCDSIICDFYLFKT